MPPLQLPEQQSALLEQVALFPPHPLAGVGDGADGSFKHTRLAGLPLVHWPTPAQQFVLPSQPSPCPPSIQTGVGDGGGTVGVGGGTVGVGGGAVGVGGGGPPVRSSALGLINTDIDAGLPWLLQIKMLAGLYPTNSERSKTPVLSAPTVVEAIRVWPLPSGVIIQTSPLVLSSFL